MKQELETPQQELETPQFDLKVLGGAALSLVVVGVTIAYGLNITSDVRADFVTNTAGCNSTDVTNCGANYNATGNAITGMSNLSSKIGTIGTIVAAVVIIGLVMLFGNIRSN